MELSELKKKKIILEGKISEAMSEFESETGLPVSGIGFVRRVTYSDLGVEIGSQYVVESKVLL